MTNDYFTECNVLFSNRLNWKESTCRVVFDLRGKKQKSKPINYVHRLRHIKLLDSKHYQQSDLVLKTGKYIHEYAKMYNI